MKQKNLLFTDVLKEYKFLLVPPEKILIKIVSDIVSKDRIAIFAYKGKLITESVLEPAPPYMRIEIIAPKLKLSEKTKIFFFRTVSNTTNDLKNSPCYCIYRFS